MNRNIFQLDNCKLCPLECGVNRLTSKGVCGANGIRLAKYYLHPFEEPCISFKNGSGTIFFSGCSLRCVFCQNYELSRAERGKDFSPKALAYIFKELEDKGAENISLVTAGHLIPYLLPAFEIYKPKIPVVYNTGSYEKIDTLKHIDPYVDIYLPDMKYADDSLAFRLSGAKDYFAVAFVTLADVSTTTFYVHVATGTEGIGTHPFLFALSLLARRVGASKNNDSNGT